MIKKESAKKIQKAWNLMAKKRSLNCPQSQESNTELKRSLIEQKEESFENEPICLKSDPELQRINLEREIAAIPEPSRTFILPSNKSISGQDY